MDRRTRRNYKYRRRSQKGEPKGTKGHDGSEDEEPPRNPRSVPAPHHTSQQRITTPGDKNITNLTTSLDDPIDLRQERRHWLSRKSRKKRETGKAKSLKTEPKKAGGKADTVR